jgi:hypothetical protein
MSDQEFLIFLGGKIKPLLPYAINKKILVPLVILGVLEDGFPEGVGLLILPVVPMIQISYFGVAVDIKYKAAFSAGLMDFF